VGPGFFLMGPDGSWWVLDFFWRTQKYQAACSAVRAPCEYSPTDLGNIRERHVAAPSVHAILSYFWDCCLLLCLLGWNAVLGMVAAFFWPLKMTPAGYLADWFLVPLCVHIILGSVCIRIPEHVSSYVYRCLFNLYPEGGSAQRPLSEYVRQSL